MPDTPTTSAATERHDFAPGPWRSHMRPGFPTVRIRVCITCGELWMSMKHTEESVRAIAH